MIYIIILTTICITVNGALYFFGALHFFKEEKTERIFQKVLKYSYIIFIVMYSLAMIYTMLFNKEYFEIWWLYLILIFAFIIASAIFTTMSLKMINENLFVLSLLAISFSLAPIFIGVISPVNVTSNYEEEMIHLLPINESTNVILSEVGDFVNIDFITKNGYENIYCSKPIIKLDEGENIIKIKKHKTWVMDILEKRRNMADVVDEVEILTDKNKVANSVILMK